LQRLARELNVEAAVTFPGRLDRDEIAELYRSAHVALNPSRVDNMPNSVLEALASGVPVVSTNVGGIPHIVRHGVSAWLVEPGDDAAMAAAIVQVLRDEVLADSLVRSGMAEVQQYAWPRVRDLWGQVYTDTLAGYATATRTA
jgi:glycosyltransferase involved in cell wall biosynthesis